MGNDAIRNDLFDALILLEKEKGISQDYMLEKVEAALLSAYKREYSGESNARVSIDKVKKEIRMYQQKEIVDTVENPITQISVNDIKKRGKKYQVGNIIETELKTKEFRRLSAQTGKQVIIQGIREAERGIAYKEYENKKDEIISVEVAKVDSLTGNVVVKTLYGYVTLPKSEQIPGEVYKVGSHIKVFISEVKKDLKGPMINISRIHPNIIKRLFELDVPEIQDGTVVIQNVSRDPGSRSKMSVYSRNPEVDPVGACIGNKGTRINSIVSELNGERIDIIKYSEIPEEYIARALSPANVNEVIIDEEKNAQVFVDADQLSLAIGKVGQNARLAAKLTGYKIDIKVK